MFFWVLDRGKRKPLTSELDWNCTVSQTFLHEFRGKLRTKNHPSLQLLNLAASRNWHSMALSWARRPPHWRSGRCWRRKSGCWPAVVGRKQNRNRARRRRRCRGSKDQQGALGRDGCRMVETSNQWRHWICSTNAKCCMVGGWCLCAVDGDTGTPPASIGYCLFSYHDFAFVPFQDVQGMWERSTRIRSPDAHIERFCVCNRPCFPDLNETVS